MINVARQGIEQGYKQGREGWELGVFGVEIDHAALSHPSLLFSLSPSPSPSSLSLPPGHLHVVDSVCFE